jgi:hypothetical protein
MLLINTVRDAGEEEETEEEDEEEDEEEEERQFAGTKATE